MDQAASSSCTKATPIERTPTPAVKNQVTATKASNIVPVKLVKVLPTDTALKQVVASIHAVAKLDPTWTVMLGQYIVSDKVFFQRWLVDAKHAGGLYLIQQQNTKQSVGLLHLNHDVSNRCVYYWFYVLPQYRGQGLGTQALAQACTMVAAANRSIVGPVIPSNFASILAALRSGLRLCELRMMPVNKVRQPVGFFVSDDSLNAAAEFSWWRKVPGSQALIQQMQTCMQAYSEVYHNDKASLAQKREAKQTLIAKLKKLNRQLYALPDCAHVPHASKTSLRLPKIGTKREQPKPIVFSATDKKGTKRPLAAAIQRPAQAAPAQKKQKAAEKQPIVYL